MEIALVEAIRLAAPLARPFHWATGTAAERRTTLVRVLASNGVEGWGETLHSDAADLIEHFFAPSLVGATLHAGGEHVGLICDKLIASGVAPSAATAAGGAVDIAIWDAAARDAEMPLARFLSDTARDRVAAYASGIYYDGLSPAAEARGYHDRGFRAVKMKIGRDDLATDLRRIACVRDAIGDLALMVDANGAYDFATALQMSKALEGAGVRWLEEPFAPALIDDYRRFHRESRVPSAVGESLPAREFSAFLTPPSIGFVQPNVAAAGGVEPALAILRNALAAGVGSAIHAWGTPVMTAVSLHVAAAAHDNVVVEIDQTPNPLREIAPDPATELRRGEVALSNAPGLGVIIDHAVLNRFRSGMRS